MKYGLYVIDANWDDKDADLLIDRAREEGAQFVAVTGHSHGAWRAGEIAKRYGPEAFDFLGLIDYCPFLDPVRWIGPPLDFPAAARSGYAVWQHNSAPTGCEFTPRFRVACDDSTAWRGPKLGHIDYPGMSSIAGDQRVWDKIEALLSDALDDRLSSSPAVAPSDASNSGAAALKGGA